MNPARLNVCNLCEFGNGRAGGCNGSCVCIADPLKRDIIALSDAGNCPKGYFSGGSTANATAATHSPPLPSPQPVPYDHWPAYATLAATKAAPGDVGVGSTIKRVLGVAGEAFKAVLRGAGLNCGCDARAAAMDAEYPYDGIDGRPPLP